MNFNKFSQVRSLAAVFALVILGAGCPDVQDVIEQVGGEPEVKVKDLVITGISAKALDLALSMEVDNPLPAEINLAGMDYDLQLAGSKMAGGESKDPMQIKAMDKSVLKVPFSLSYKDVQNVYDAAKGKDEIPYQVKGTVKLATPAGDLPIPYDVKGNLPVVRPPTIKGVSADVKKFDLSGASMDMKVKLYNPNSFDLDINKLDYKVTLEGKDFTRSSGKGQSVSSKSEGELVVPMDMDFSGLTTWAAALVTKGKASYDLEYNATYKMFGWDVNQKETSKGNLKI